MNVRQEMQPYILDALRTGEILFLEDESQSGNSQGGNNELGHLYTVGSFGVFVALVWTKTQVEDVDSSPLLYNSFFVAARFHLLSNGPCHPRLQQMV